MGTIPILQASAHKIKVFEKIVNCVKS